MGHWSKWPVFCLFFFWQCYWRAYAVGDVEKMALVKLAKWVKRVKCCCYFCWLLWYGISCVFTFITSLLWDPICTYRPIYFVGFMNSWLSQNKLPSVTSNTSKISIPVGYVSWASELGCWSHPDHLSHSCFPCLGNSGAPGGKHCFPLFGPVLF